MKRKAKFILNGCFIGLTTAIVVALSVAIFGPFSDSIDTFIFPGKTEKKNYSSGEDGELTSQEVADKIESEGAVLLKNEDECLPLMPQDLFSVNVFGWSSTQWIAGGSGSGRVLNKDQKEASNTDLLTALENRGYAPNQDLIDFYKNYCPDRPYISLDGESASKGALRTFPYEFCRLVEPLYSDDSSKSEYPQDLLDSAKSYSDTAIVVLSRTCGESMDCPKEQYKGAKISSKASDTTRTYLQISTEEEALLTYVGETYNNVIVVLNTTNTMELGFLNTIDGLDACLLVGATGTDSAAVIPDILDGTITPSGKLTDTYAYDMKTNPSYANAAKDGEGAFINARELDLYPYNTNFTNGSSTVKFNRVSYVDYCENIYVGYKWYETADSEKYFNSIDNKYGKGYDGVVQYPFGYGLSYTEFSWTIDTPSITLNEDSSYKYQIQVTVTNDGFYEGKDVVELYYEPPYVKGGVEKASCNLLAFEKTGIIQPGDSETVILEFTVEDLLSYDCYDANKNNHKGYELEQGDYKLSLKTDSHHVKNMAAPTLILNVPETKYFDKDIVSGKDVTNKFTGTDAIDGTSSDGNDVNSNITYLSRNDFKSTFPTERKPDRKIDDKALYTKDGTPKGKTNVYTKYLADQNINKDDEPITMGAKNGLKLWENDKFTDLAIELGSDFNDPKWDTLLDQLTFNDLKSLTSNGFTKTVAISSVGKPALKDYDGPAQIISYHTSNPGTVGFPDGTVVAQTWNKELAEKFGYSMGVEAKGNGVSGWYGPGMNIHRTPFGGRNYEYYSEDSKLSGDIGAHTILGSNSAGLYCYLKHVVLNDQDENRDGLYNYVTEQALREIYLKPFKTTIQKGHAPGVMSSFVRIGNTYAGGSKALLTGVLRDEWGFNGCIVTDYIDHPSYMNPCQSLIAGGDLTMKWGGTSYDQFQTVDSTFENTFNKMLREACKHILYCWIYQPPEGESKRIPIATVTPAPWRPIIGAIDGVLGVGIATWAFFIYAFPFLNKKKSSSLEPKTNIALDGETKTDLNNLQKDVLNENSDTLHNINNIEGDEPSIDDGNTDSLEASDKIDGESSEEDK